MTPASEPATIVTPAARRAATIVGRDSRRADRVVLGRVVRARGAVAGGRPDRPAERRVHRDPLVGQATRQRRVEAHVPVEPDERAVLDGRDARVHGARDRLGRVAVRCDRHAVRVRDVDGRPQDRERQLCELRPRARRQAATADHDLHSTCPGGELTLHECPGGRRRRDLAAEDAEVPADASERRPGEHDVGARCFAGREPFGGGTDDVQWRAEVADGRDARPHRARGIRQRQLDERRRVQLADRAHRVGGRIEGEMDVDVDEARHEPARRVGFRRSRPDAGDAIADHDDIAWAR